MTEYLNPWNLPYPEFGMNPGVATTHLVFAGGMSFDFETMSVRRDADSVATETRQCLEEIEAILQAAGCTKRDIVKTTCYISDEKHRFEMLNAYKEFFEPGPYPARVTIVAGIAGGCNVEIDSIAMRQTD